MLKDDLYNIKNISEENNSLLVTVNLNKDHSIFKGHFPSQPLLPGVCMLQMLREILESNFDKKLQLVKADDIRFTAMIDPDKNSEIKFDIQFKQTEERQINVTSKILNTEKVICCKLKATYKLLP